MIAETQITLELKDQSYPNDEYLKGITNPYFTILAMNTQVKASLQGEWQSRAVCKNTND